MELPSWDDASDEEYISSLEQRERRKSTRNQRSEDFSAQSTRRPPLPPQNRSYPLKSAYYHDIITDESIGRNADVSISQSVHDSSRREKSSSLNPSSATEDDNRGAREKTNRRRYGKYRSSSEDEGENIVRDASFLNTSGNISTASTSIDTFACREFMLNVSDSSKLLLDYIHRINEYVTHEGDIDDKVSETPRLKQT